MSKTARQRQRLERAYKRATNPEQADEAEFGEVVKKYSYLVRRWARRYAGTSQGVVDWDDLVSVGIMGLLQAKRRFDPTSGKPFESYAEYRIKGAILDELRRVDPFSQPMRRKVRKVSRAIETLSHRLGHQPDDADLAEYLDMTVAQVRKLLQHVQELRFTSVEEIDRHSSLSSDLAVSGWNRSDLKVALAQSIKTLDQRSQTILGLYYFEGLSMSEIGKVVGVTEARISQLHTAAIKVLRAAITNPNPKLVRKKKRGRPAKQVAG